MIARHSSSENLTVETTCPPWMTQQDGKCMCNQAFSNHIQRNVFIQPLFCDKQSQTTYVASGTCVTYSNTNTTVSENEVVIGSCPYAPIRKQSYTYGVFRSLPENSSDLDRVMCSPFNRQGPLCGSCRPGYGVAVYSIGYPCEKCYATRVYTFLYIAIELVPITVFYIVVIVFRIRATAPPLAGLVFFSHVILSTIQVRIFIHTTLLYSTTKSIRIAWQLILFFCSIWSLDFFRVWVPPFCINESLTNVHAVLLEYISAFYPLVLVLFTLLAIELHGRNVRLFVRLWKPFHKCFFHFGKTWDIQYSIINAFSTFLLLSYSKILSVSFKLLYQTSIYNINGTHIAKCLYIDPMVKNFGSSQQDALAVMAILIIIIFTVLPLLLLLFYPTRFFQKVLRCFTCRAKHAVHLFTDTYQGCLKDGSEGTSDYRSVSALYLFLRFTLLGFYIRDTELAKSGLSFIIFSLMFIVCGILIVTFKPYKDKISNYTEFGVLFLLGNISLFTYAWFIFLRNGYAIVIMTLSLVPHCITVCYVVYLAISKYKGKEFRAWIKRRIHLYTEGGERSGYGYNLALMRLLRNFSHEEDALENYNELPDRFINPDDYPQTLTSDYNERISRTDESNESDTGNTVESSL